MVQKVIAEAFLDVFHILFAMKVFFLLKMPSFITLMCCII